MKKKLKQFQRQFRKWKRNFLIRNTVVTIILTIWTLSGSIPFLDNLSLNPLFHEAQAAEANVDITSSTTQTEHTGSASTIVVVSNTNAYAFYVDSGGQCVYSKTTDLNAATPTWNAAVQIDSQTDCMHVAVWYDRWTPGDNSGNYIHIITQDANPDDLWYNRLDVSSDTRLLTAAPISISSSTAPAKTNTFVTTANMPAVTKGTDGTIYAGVMDDAAASSWVHKCSTTCQTQTNWTDESPDFETATYPLLENDTMLLMPQPGGDIMMIVHNDTNDDIVSKIYDQTGDSWGNFAVVDNNTPNNTTYDGGLGATIDRSTFEIYLAYSSQNATVGTDDDVRTAIYNPVSAAWASTTNCITDLAITNAKIARDESSGTIYCVYTRRTTAGTATTGNVYYKTSTDEMVSWSGESASLTTTPDDLYGMKVPILSNQHIYVTWYDLAADDINGNTVSDLTPITSVLEQAVYRFFDNADSTDVGSTLAASNANPTLTSKGQAFRLRVLLRVTTANLATSGQQFKLQFTNKGGGACTSSTLTWEDVNGTTRIAFNNNATPTDGTALTANANDPTNGGDTIVNQTYEEANAFTNSQAAVNTTQDGKWDFSLYDANGVGSATYCFRVVKNGGDSLDTMTVYPEVTIAAPPTYTQSNFRFYANADSADVGAASAAQNANYTMTTFNEAFRLRMLVGLSGTGMGLNGISMKLQFAAKGVGTCAAPTGTYTDVNGSTAISYNNNATPADGAAATSNANDPTSSNTIRKQTYEEANNFTNSQLAIAAGEDGMWDFSLIDNDMDASATYCLRIVGSDNTALNTYSQYPEITSLGGSIDKTPSATGANFLGGSPTTVFTTDQIGYTFYIDSTGTAVYRKTSDGGDTWGAAVTVDSQPDVVNVAVWYDQWTPGDDTGTLIHVLTADSGNDDLWYTSLNTSSDTLTTPASTVTQSGQSGSFDTNTMASIAKFTSGYITMVVSDNTDSFGVGCNTSCSNSTNWLEAGAFSISAQPNAVILLPLASANGIAIAWDRNANAIVSRVYTDATDTWETAVTIDSTNAENTTYGSAFGATLDKATNNIYLTFSDDSSTLGTDDDIRMYTYSGGSWTQNTDILTNESRGVTDAKIAWDETNSDLYAVYTVRTTSGTPATGTVYYKVSTNNGSSWGSEQGPITAFSSDLYGLKVNIMSDERIYATYDDDTGDTLIGVTVADLVAPETPGTLPAYVQSDIDPQTTSQTTNAITFSSDVTTGNLVVVSVSLWNTNSDAEVTSVVDNQGNSYQLAVQNPTPQTGSVQPLAIYYAYNVTGGSNFTVTVTSAQSAFITVAISEYTGIARLIDPLDRTATANAIGAGTTTADSGNTSTTRSDYELVVGAFTQINNTNTGTAGTGFTMRESNNDNETSEALYTEDKFVTTKGAYNATMTFASGVEWRAIAATFRAGDSPPNNEDLMRHGGYFNNNGVEHKFIF